MSQFEKYHPILTAHFELDWLTQFRVNGINQLRRQNGHDESMIETAEYVNRQMSAIMKDQALIWGIGRQNKDVFIGLFGFNLINRSQSTAQLVLEITHHADKARLFEELIPHMMTFAKAELQLTHLTVTSHNNPDDWHQLGFIATGPADVLTYEIP